MRRVALLGSVNVGGNRVAMADLRTAMVDAGFAQVKTVVASGNVIFDADGRASDATLADRIAALVKDRFGFEPFVAVRTLAELRAAIDANPFAADGEARLVHSCFLECAIDQFAVDRLANANPGTERLALGDRVLFVDFRDGVAGSKLTRPMLERHLGCRSTARNIRSLARIADAMEPA